MSKLLKIFRCISKYFKKSAKVDNFSTDETNQQIIQQELFMNEKLRDSQETLDQLTLDEIDDNFLDVRMETSDINEDYFSIKTN